MARTPRPPAARNLDPTPNYLNHFVSLRVSLLVTLSPTKHIHPRIILTLRWHQNSLNSLVMKFPSPPPQVPSTKILPQHKSKSTPTPIPNTDSLIITMFLSDVQPTSIPQAKYNMTTQVSRPASIIEMILPVNHNFLKHSTQSSTIKERNTSPPSMPRLNGPHADIRHSLILHGGMIK